MLVTTIDLVVAFFSEKHVVVVATVDAVIAMTAVDFVSSMTAKEKIRAIATDEHIVPAQTFKLVVAAETDQTVAAMRTDEVVGKRRADHDVGILGAACKRGFRIIKRSILRQPIRGPTVNTSARVVRCSIHACNDVRRGIRTTQRQL